MRPVMLITGGSRGIGAATARLAAERGYDVVISFRDNAAAADQAVVTCGASGAAAMAVRVDVGVEQDVVELFAAAIDAFGRIDAVVNNAGTLHRAARLDEMSVERLEEVTRVNGSARSWWPARQCGLCRRGTAATAGRSSTCRRPRPTSAARASTSTTPRRKAPSTR